MNARTAHWVRWLRPGSLRPKLQELKRPDEPGFLTLQVARKRGEAHHHGFPTFTLVPISGSRSFVKNTFTYISTSW